MRVAIIGANGQLGSDLVQVLSGWDVHPLTRPECDVRDSTTIQGALRGIRPTVVINTAALTDVDACENDVRQAFDVNACAVQTVAEASAALGAVLVQVSTDYVFDGAKGAPYQEDDAAHPLNVYGISKLAGEYVAQSACFHHFVVRTSGLYGAAGSRGKGGNFVETVIRIAREGRPIRVVNDQVLAPTYTRDVAQAIRRLISTEAYGVYHVTNSGACSWYEFAGRIFKRLDLAPELTAITSAEWGARARRPPYSVLATEKLADAGGGELRVWTEALDDYLMQKGYL